MIKAAGYLMGEKFPRHRKTLLTITLPPMSQELRAEVVRLWPEMTRQLIQWVTRRLRLRGLPPLVCSVTEVQPERLQDLNEGYLHWHLLYLNIPARNGKWTVVPNLLRAWVDDLLCRLLSVESVGYVNVNVKPVYGEAARYLAKYMSKGKQMIREAMADWGAENCPKTWWNLSKVARDMVNKYTSQGEGTGALLESLVEHGWLTDPDDFFAFLRPVMVDFDGVEVVMGWRGRLAREVHRDLMGMLNCD